MTREKALFEKLFEKLNSVENRDREQSFRFFETENREMGCHSRIENDFVEISTTLISGPKGPRGTRGNGDISEARFILYITF